MVFAAEAEVRFIDHAAERLSAHPRHVMALALSGDKPKRGRPAKVGAGAPA